MWRPVLFSLIVTLGTLQCRAADRAPTTAPATIQIVGIDGQSYEPLVVEPHKAAVLVFVLQDCPISNGYAPQIERLNDKYSAQGVTFYLVHVDPTLSVADATKHAKDFHYQIPVLIDRKHELVSRLHVETVPTAVVLGSDGATRYNGRIDDQYAAIGRPRNVTTTHELHDAIIAVLDGKPVPVRQTYSVGCAVPDLPAHNDK